MIGSDYSGTHKGSKYITYSFVSVDAQSSTDWPLARSEWRTEFLSDGRRLSFKGLADRIRLGSLGPFLETLHHLHGHCVVLGVTKSLDQFSSSPRAFELWGNAQNLKGRWKVKDFEQLSRVAHLFAVLVAEFSQPGQHVTWITDDDQVVANDARLTDAMLLASKFTGGYCPHSLGEFAMNTSSVDGFLPFEDFVSIPDLFAGALSELLNGTSLQLQQGRPPTDLDSVALSSKARVLLDWLFGARSGLRPAAFLIDGERDAGFRLFEVRFEH